MSWYNNKMESLKLEYAFRQQPSNMPSQNLYWTANQDIPLTIKVTNMNTMEDKEEITEALLALKGINSVKAVLDQKRLIISYNPAWISLAKVSYTLSSLGYTYIQRA